MNRIFSVLGDKNGPISHRASFKNSAITIDIEITGGCGLH
jgi:hypothetical protein